MNRTIILLLALSSALGVTALTTAWHTDSQTEKVIKITAKKFEFSPSEIKVKKGELVTLELTSADRIHGFKLPDFNVRAEVKPGEVSRVQFTPNKSGSFTFSCDVFCGSGHEDMSGTLIVAN